MFFFFYFTHVPILVDWDATDPFPPLYVNNNRFLYDGTRINDDDTPQSLEMEDNGTVLPLFSHLSARHSDWLNLVKPYDRHHRRHG